MQTTDSRFKKILKLGVKSGLIRDSYHSLLTLSWPKFFIVYGFFFLTFNFIFGTVYWLIPNALTGTTGLFWQSYVFSVQTFSTIGYGVFAPSAGVAHVVVVIEAMLSVLVTALLTGILFAKFSRPMARVLFSKNVLIHQFDGKPTMMIRLGNLRSNQILEAQIRMVALKSHTTPEGEVIRRQIDVPLVRSSSLFFALTWSVMHIIDEKSPFYGLDALQLKENNIELAVSVTGYDSSFSQSVHASVIYQPEDFIFDRYFADIVISEKNKVTKIDYRKFNDLKSQA